MSGSRAEVDPGHARGTLVAAAAWGMAEATIFVIVPDVWVGWVALERPRELAAAWLAAVGGGTAGAVLVHQAVRHGVDPGPVFRSLPGARPGDPGRVRDELARGPASAFARGAVSGLPLKVYVAEAARQGLPLSRTAGLAVLNRAPRIGLFGALVAGLGGWARRRGTSGSAVRTAYVLGWATFYAWFWVLRPRRG